MVSTWPARKAPLGSIMLSVTSLLSILCGLVPSQMMGVCSADLALFVLVRNNSSFRSGSGCR